MGNEPKKEFGKNQVVRVKETHDANGVHLIQGQLAWVFTGETYGVLTPNEIAIQLEQDGPFVGVDKNKIEPYTGDPMKLHVQVMSYLKGEERLRLIEQRYKDIGAERLANAVHSLRKHLHIKAMTECLGADPVESNNQWEEIEEELRSAGIPPYQINVGSKIVN